MQEGKIIQHLEVLRTCLLKSFIGLAVGVVVAFIFTSLAFQILSKPYLDFLAQAGLSTDFVFRSLAPVDTLQAAMKSALMFGFGLSFPWIFYHAWAFVGPALYKYEKKYVLTFCFIAAAFFVAGVVFAYYAVLPVTLAFFYKYSVGMGIVPEWTISNYLGFATVFLAGFGLVFELPVVVVILTWLKIVTPQALSKYRRHTIIGIFILAGIFTPGPDVASQLMMAVPMVILYEISIIAARIIAKIS